MSDQISFSGLKTLYDNLHGASMEIQQAIYFLGDDSKLNQRLKKILEQISVCKEKMDNFIIDFDIN